MMNVGIVGSSFSSGKINIAKDAKTIDWENYSDADYELGGKYGDEFITTKPLTQIFKDSDQDSKYNFHSLAKSGFGSEKYLSDVIYLKKRYDIKILLLEFIENRSTRYRPNSYEFYGEIIQDSNLNSNKFMDLCKDEHSDSMLYERIHAKEWNRYLNNENTPKSTLFFTLHNIIQTIDLCKLLGVFPIIWCFSIWMGSVKIFNFEPTYYLTSLFKDHHLLRFGKHYEAFEFFYKKYNGKQRDFLCDGCHLNDKANYDLVQNHLLPEIEKIYNYIK